MNISIANRTGRAQLVHVFDTLTGGTRPVEGSPFELANGARSEAFAVKAGPSGHGLIAYRCQSGWTKLGVDVTNGNCVEIG